MKRIGIITHYYGSLNYGGVLQSYALTAYLNKNGFCAEQISYPLMAYSDFLSKDESRIKRILRNPVKSGYVFLREIFFKNSRKARTLKNRIKAFANLRDSLTPHSFTVYDHVTVKKCVKEYDIFVTGSDQVWNFAWYNPAFFLDFVPGDKTKVAYGASVGNSGFSEEEKETVKNSLADFKAVSVREKSSVPIISELTDKTVHNVIDPTLLLDKEDWDEVCAPRVYGDKYVFCYFLGTNSEAKKCADKFAKEHNLKTVYIPYVNGERDETGEKCADILAEDVSPEKFISLVRYADYVFTDSFHAIVFSYLYNKQFFVFHRSENGEMSERITDFCSLIGAEDRFCKTKSQMTTEYFNNLLNSPVCESAKINDLKRLSIEFIKGNFV